jgi:hypothetical protein
MTGGVHLSAGRGDGPAERPRPNGERGSNQLERRKKQVGLGWAERVDGPKATEKKFFVE